MHLVFMVRVDLILWNGGEVLFGIPFWKNTDLVSCSTFYLLNLSLKDILINTNLEKRNSVKNI